MCTLCCVLIIIFGLVRLERFVSSLCHSVDESPPVKINDNNIMMYVVTECPENATVPPNGLHKSSSRPSAIDFSINLLWDTLLLP